VAPPLILLGCDPVWLAILMAVNLQTSFLTPPFGFALFYLRGAAPPEVTTMQIWQGAMPFIGLQILLLTVVAAMPQLATWLPSIAAK
jgi:TRAP-type mannitol/chloroaromatic compound transport system permease large subunit